MSDDARAQEMQRATRELVPSTCGVRQFMAYTWVAREAGSQATVDWMGLTNRTVEPRGALNATGRAFAQVTRELRATGGQATTLCGPAS
jgi:hypothetical protein